MRWWSRPASTFTKGLNLLTGETGSGKSIVVDSLSLLLGARASARYDSHRSGQGPHLRHLPVRHDPEAARAIEEAGIDIDDEDVIVEREISSQRKIAGLCWRTAR